MKKYSVKKLFAGLSSMCVMAQALPAISFAENTNVVYGDANVDGTVSIADAVLIMQAISNADEYQLSAGGANNADVYNRGDGISTVDALSIQKFVADSITELPESWQDAPVTEETKIHLNGDSITVDGDYAEVSGTTVTISHSGSYYIDGTLNDGQINVNVPDETVDAETVKIFLNGVNITRKSAPAILITNAENTSINLVDGTENFISDGDTAYSGDNLGDAVIEAKDDFTIKGGDLGTGILNLTANTQNAIVCNNDIKITGGTLNVTTLNSTDKTNAINGKTSVTVKGGTVNIDAEGDGLKSSKGNVAITDGTLNIKAGNDAIQAETTIDISGGSVVAGGDRGLTSVTGTNITGGYVLATATDNQTDTTLLTSSQNVLLFNCVDNAENTDGTWKKANSFTYNNTATEFVKKYKYILFSNSDISDGSYTFKNNSTGGNFTHDGSESFSVKSGVNVFDNVNPAGTSGSTTNPDTSSYTITLSANSIETNAPEDVASVSNNVLTIKKPAVLTVSGENKGGQIVVDVDKTTYPEGVVELDLSNASISNDTVAPIYVASIGDEVQIVAKSGTVNTVSDGTSHTDTYTDSDGNTNQINSAIFARDDIKIKGSGTLTVNGNTEDGIVSKNDIKIYNGNITVNAVDDAIRGKDSVTIGNADNTDFSTFNLNVKSESGKGIKSNETDDETKGFITINGGTVSVTSYSDAIHASRNLTVNGGTIDITTTCPASSSGGNSGWGGNSGGGFGGWGEGNGSSTSDSAKGLKAGVTDDTTGTTTDGAITINGGDITITSTDDSIHASGTISINDGSMTLSTGDDGIHSDTKVVIGIEGKGFDAPYVDIIKSYEGVEGVDVEVNSGTILVTSSDDGYNAAGGTDNSGNQQPGGWGQGGMGGGSQTLVFNGGYTYVNASGDGLDSNGTLTVNGGYIFVSQTGGGNSPIDCDTTWNYNGGTVIAGGSSDMFSESIPASYAVCNRSVSIGAGTAVTLADDSGNVIGTMDFVNSASAIVLCGDGTKAYTGGTLNGTTYFESGKNNLKAGYGGTISGGTEITSNTSGGGQGGRW